LGVLGQTTGELMPLILNTILTWVAVGIVIVVYGTDLKRKVALTAKNVDAELNRVELL